jgi:hypothetical protein
VKIFIVALMGFWFTRASVACPGSLPFAPQPYAHAFRAGYVPSQAVRLAVADCVAVATGSRLIARHSNKSDYSIYSFSDTLFAKSIPSRGSSSTQQSLDTVSFTLTPLAILGILVGITFALLIIWAFWMIPMAGVAFGFLPFLKALGLAFVSLLLQLLLAVAVTFPITSKIEQMGARFRPTYRILLTIALVLGVLMAIAVGALVSLVGLGAAVSLGHWLLLTATSHLVMFALILAVWLFVLIFFTRSTRLKRKLEQKFNFRF